MIEAICRSSPDGGKGCGARILWVRTVKGKLLPVDDNDVVRVAVFGDQTATWEDLRKRPELAEVLKPHWATCPNADTFRRKPARAENGVKGAEGRHKGDPP